MALADNWRAQLKKQPNTLTKEGIKLLTGSYLVLFDLVAFTSDNNSVHI